jgi:hypothetical protein
MMNTGFADPAFRFEHPSLDTKSFITADLLLLRHQFIRADFSGGQISSDADLLPLRAFAQRHHLTGDWAVAVHVWLLPSIGGERFA